MQQPQTERPAPFEPIPESARGTTAGLDVVLRDGSTVRLRPVRGDDIGRLRTFLENLSEQARWFRFFSGAVSLDDAARAAVEAGGGLSLVAVTGADEHIIGQGGYFPLDDGRAEVAFAVADRWQDHGIATILLAHLADAAADAGIGTFVAFVLPGNHRMITVFRTSGYPVEVRAVADEITVSLPTSLTPEGRRQFEERERMSSVAAARHVLRPASIVVVADERLTSALPRSGTFARGVTAARCTWSTAAREPSRRCEWRCHGVPFAEGCARKGRDCGHSRVRRRRSRRGTRVRRARYLRDGRAVRCVRETERLGRGLPASRNADGRPRQRRCP
jgi:RimJ/RimL family protein N-acetyltransferase